MITDYKNVVPFISFGFGSVKKQASAGQTFKVYMESIYNVDEYRFFLDIPVGATYTEVTDYEYDVVFSEHGTFNIKLNIIPFEKAKAIISNPLTITVI